MHRHSRAVRRRRNTRPTSPLVRSSVAFLLSCRGDVRAIGCRAHPLAAAEHHDEETARPKATRRRRQPTPSIQNMRTHAASTTTCRRPMSPAIGTRSGQWGNLKLTIGYYIDTLTVTMFCMVTLIASCIHFYAFGYMHDELHDVHRPRSHTLRRPSPASPRPVPPLLPVPVAVLLQMLGIVHRRQHGDGVRVLGTGGHLLVLPDRLLHRAAQREHRGQQGVHRQPRRRLRHAHRPDGALVEPRHVHLRRHDRTRDGNSRRPRHLQPAAHAGERLPARAGRQHDGL